MTPESVAHLVGQMFSAAFWIAAPLLAIGLIAGILVSLVQVVTSIQDSSFSTVPRLTVFLVTLLVAMPWMMTAPRPS